MNGKKYKQIRVLVSFFIAALVAVSVNLDSYLLAIVAVLTGMLFMIVARSKAKIRTDEREVAIQEKAARMTCAIFAPTIAIASFLMLLPSKSKLAVFSQGEWLYLESLGMVFAYLALFFIAIHAISYHFFNRKYGGKSDEE